MTVLTDEGKDLQVEDRWPQTVAEFESAVERLQHELVHFASCRLANLQDAEDAVQEVLVRAFIDRSRYRSVTRFTPFVYRMLINRCNDVLRERRRHSGWAPPEPLWEDDPIARGEAARVRELLERIPAKEADVVRLRLWSDLNFEAIAGIMETPVPTAKSRYRYALNRLRSLISEGERR